MCYPPGIMSNLLIAVGVTVTAVVLVGATVGLPRALHYVQNFF